jgi:hypothetical protein
MGGALELIALADIDLGKLGIEVVEHALGCPRPGCQIAFDRDLDALRTLGGKPLLIRLAPSLLPHEIGAQARDRFFLPARLDVLCRAVATGVIGGRMVAEPIC